MLQCLYRLALLCTFLAISACQTPVIPQNHEPTELRTALQHLENQEFKAAHNDLQIARQSNSELLKQQALAGLCLLHLQNQDISSATRALDEFYYRALRNPQTDNSLAMLRLSLKLNMENAQRLIIENQARLAAEAKQKQLHSEALALQRALEKLRQLSLQ